MLGFVHELGFSYQGIREEIPETSFVKVHTFNSDRKSMTTVVPLQDGTFRLFCKGASEIILAKSVSGILLSTIFRLFSNHIKLQSNSNHIPIKLQSHSSQIPV